MAHSSLPQSTIPICVEADCFNKVLARNRCGRHYRAFMQWPECLVDVCTARSVAHGYCSRHYQRLRNYGDPLFSIKNVGKGNFPEQRFWSKVAITANPDKCWIWQATVINTGYGYFALRGKRWLAHRLAWLLTKGVEPTLDLLHSCDNPRCVNPNHLREGTAADNAADRVERGRALQGSSVASSKLNEGDVLDICGSLASGISTYKLAAQYGVCAETIRKIKTGTSWTHVARKL